MRSSLGFTVVYNDDRHWSCGYTQVLELLIKAMPTWLPWNLVVDLVLTVKGLSRLPVMFRCRMQNDRMSLPSGRIAPVALTGGRYIRVTDCVRHAMQFVDRKGVEGMMSTMIE
jgi:hypothetical protein